MLLTSENGGSKNGQFTNKDETSLNNNDNNYSRKVKGPDTKLIPEENAKEGQTNDDIEAKKVWKEKPENSKVVPIFK